MGTKEKARDTKVDITTIIDHLVKEWEKDYTTRQTSDTTRGAMRTITAITTLTIGMDKVETRDQATSKMLLCY